ncbi:heavy metal sensor histidine kinase [Achromobacter xylosoxidans]|uniref:heavy metal sensor histidine kinase n=1 Tax=Alcaligenes xylosoxydans xylosoxydans TaxID=85698 RepID=UPI001F058D01|nr:heavy metal sensor histidine kinase [Achromobacter xylosoxidans]MCH1987189.1 heavy metal sensor histidine kinase [Achromobacter xylosoxidans]MCH4586222.1 heavy metal sensor histidine kinase [Achromobacter xylosoxidans]
MPAPRPRSLRRWLTRWLAILTFAGLGLVCVAVYWATNRNLSIRQEALLAQKMEVIRHLVEENAAKGDSASLRHKLEDFFYGRPDFSLALEIDGARVVYGGPGDGEAGHGRHINFALPVPGSPGGSTNAELVLDITSDLHLRAALAWALLACALAGAIVVSAIGTRLVRRALAPIDELGRQAARLSPDRIGERLDESQQAEEIRPLVHQFNAVLQRLERAYVQMEGFNADVAHELRTPLATLIGETELALSGKRPEAVLRDILGSNLEELQRLSGIVNDMLFLSQADRGAQARGSWTASLAQVLSEVADYHEAEAMEADLSFAVSGEAAAHVDRPLLQRAVSNLVSNAVRYAHRGTRIDLLIDRGDEGIRIAVRNHGDPIGQEHLPRLFYRFYRMETARVFDANHHGLGLAIVAAIARMHGGRPFACSEGGVITIGFWIADRNITEN